MANLIPRMAKNGIILNNRKIKRNNNLLLNSDCNNTQFGDIFEKRTKKRKERKRSFSENVFFWTLNISDI